MNKIKPYLHWIVIAVFFIAGTLFVFLFPRTDNDALYTSFEKHKINYQINSPVQSAYEAYTSTNKTIEVERIGNNKKGKTYLINLAPSLNEDQISLRSWGVFFFIKEGENFSGGYFRMKRNAKDVYALIAESDKKVIRAGNYLIILYESDDEISPTMQAVLDDIGGVSEKNF